MFDFTLKHVPGTKMGKLDRLSRRLDWKVGVENDNNNQTLIKEQWICNLAEVVIEGSSNRRTQSRYSRKNKKSKE